MLASIKPRLKWRHMRRLEHKTAREARLREPDCLAPESCSFSYGKNEDEDDDEGDVSSVRRHSAHALKSPRPNASLRCMTLRFIRYSFLMLGLAFVSSITQGAQQPRFDILILNGHIIDGTGSPWYAGDIGIRSGRIAAIGHLQDAPHKETIDAQGKVVAPGFIDMLGQSELSILVQPRLPPKIFQGITTETTR